jgi:hypothetical protein
MCAVAPATPGCREIRHSGWQSDIRLISAVDVDFTSRVYPGVQPSFEWANFAVPLVYQHAGDTRRAGFVWSTAIHHDIVVVQAGLERFFSLGKVNRNCARDMPRIQLARGMRARIEHHQWHSSPYHFL